MSGKPTHFVEKIWTAFNLGVGGYQIDFARRRWWIKKCDLSNAIDRKLIPAVGIKIHTIRADQKNRWRVGKPIHFVIHNRTPLRFQFAPVLPVKAIQSIQISWIDGGAMVTIDGEPLRMGEMELLAKNDGFQSTSDFFKYFNQDFEGKIIHWTDFVYTT